ncbi:hypothetical protein [Actinoplanes sp. NPDC051859]|uniref:hypothetical protein n=1 Tax=Actinoplanes sp. NPDC051859 TaxID=3363909 RepID=UPI00379A38D3
MTPKLVPGANLQQGHPLAQRSQIVGVPEFASHQPFRISEEGFRKIRAIRYKILISDSQIVPQSSTDPSRESIRNLQTTPSTAEQSTSSIPTKAEFHSG